MTQRERRVPLVPRAIATLDEMRKHTGEEGLIFPSVTGKAFSDSTLSKLVREQGIQAVPHGFRSSFRDWCGETGQPREVAEACLAHAVKNKVEVAYVPIEPFQSAPKSDTGLGGVPHKNSTLPNTTDSNRLAIPLYTSDRQGAGIISMAEL